MTLYVNGLLTPPADAGSLDGIPAALQPVGPAVDGYVVTYDDATGDLELQPGGGGGMVNPMNAVGNLIVGGAVVGGIATPTRLAIGTNGYVLRVVGGTPVWRELFDPGTSQPPAASTREGQWYWTTSAAAGLEMSVCTHQGGGTYAWVAVPYGVTATGVALVQAADAAAARSALGLASAPPISLGAAYNEGSSATAYLDVAGTPPAAPLGGPGETLVYLFFPVGLGTDARIMVQHMDSGSFARGWEIRCGDNGDRGILSMLLAGMNGNGVFELPGATFTSGLNVPHVLALAITAGGVPRYSWDGKDVIALPALSGTYNPPIAGDPFTIGGRSGGNYPASKVQIVQFRAYSTVLLDADLVAVAATRTSFRLADPSAGTLTTDISASNASGFGSVLDSANTARRWRINGELKAQEQL
jgi:hypothetical protein